MACREMGLGFVSTLITDIAVLFSIPTFIFLNLQFKIDILYALKDTMS